MSGHSKWSTIKHKKAGKDAKRGRLFTKLIKELTVSARLGGGDPEGNPRLRSAVATAKGANMPADNIKRAIQKGTGELPGVTYDEVVYEGYGPGGVAILLEVLTDNKNRTTAELRHLLSKHGGNLGEPNSVAWIFEKKGFCVVPASATTEDRLMEIVLDAGADDLHTEEGEFHVVTTPDAFEGVRGALEEAGIGTTEASLTMEPQNTVHLDGKKVEQCIKLLEVLEDHDDVQNVHANVEFDDADLEAGTS